MPSACVLTVLVLCKESRSHDIFDSTACLY
jgi:hypothetical protein